MKTWRSGVLGVALAASACSGRYEVGGMDPDVAGSGGGGSSAGTGTANVAGSQPGGGGGATPGEGSGPTCGVAGAPPVVIGPFVAPSAVWARLMPFVWGDTHAPPSQLPAQASYDWASELVDQAFGEAVADAGGVAGANWFIRQWLDLDSDAALEDDYGVRLAEPDNLLLEHLLVHAHAGGHVGVFTEPAWLLRHRSIPARGAGLSAALFGRIPPAPPPDVPQTVDSGLPDRLAIEQRTSEAVCAGCHAIFNGLGFALGNFDALGNYRELDHGLPIDTSGTYAPADSNLTFDGIVELGQQATMDCTANRAVVEHFVRIALTAQGYEYQQVQDSVVAHGERIFQAFVAGGRSYPALVKAYAQSPLVLK